MNIPRVIDSVVSNDLCIGCGICVARCPNQALKMKWNAYGFLTPEAISNCDSDGSCINVCPFNPSPKNEVKTENELGSLFLLNAKHSHHEVGRYNKIFVGYSNTYRATSSSGGIATHIFIQLVESKVVDHIFSVRESKEDNTHFEYRLCSSKDEILAASKTKYYPVTLATVMPIINQIKGKVAIVGVACFVKAIRLAQYEDNSLKEKIPFLVGIICGGIKSRFFTEYLSGKAGVENKNVVKPQFRIKDTKSTAIDYSYGCYDQSIQQLKTIKMKTVGDMWGTGLFKANACDYCDDVATELADISLGDAWLPPYKKDGCGTSVIISRSNIADQLLQNGIQTGELKVETLPLERFLASQQGSFNHRHIGLSYRLRKAQKHNKPVPPKRFNNDKVSIDFKVVQTLRMNVRQESLEVWKGYSEASLFDLKMKNSLLKLKIATTIYHYKKKILKKIMKTQAKS